MAETAHHPHRFLYWDRVLSALGGALFSLISLVIILVMFFPNSPLLSDRLSQKIGRDFRINGPVHINWSWTTPTIDAQGITLANAPNLPDPYMVKIDRLKFQIKLWPILSGRLVFPEILIEKPLIILEKNPDGSKNWEFPALSKASAVTSAALPSNRHNFPAIGELIVNDGTFIYRDKKADLDIDLKLETVRGEGGPNVGGIRVNGTGSLQDKAFKLNAQGGSIRTLRDSNKPFPLNLDLVMGATKVHVKGTFLDPVKMKGIDSTLDLSGDNMADLYYLTAIPLPPTPAYSLRGQLKKEGEVWSYNEFKGRVGQSDLGGNLKYDTSGERGFFTADLNSQRMRIADLGGFIGQTGHSEKKSGDRVLPDVPINLERLRATDMDVKLNIAKLEAPSLPFKGMDVRFDLDHGLLKLDPMRLTLADGTVRGGLTLDGRKDVPDVGMNLVLDKIKLGRFFIGTRFEKSTQSNIGGTIDLRGQGRSLADVLAVSNGRIAVGMSGGTMSLLLVEGSDLDLAEAAPLLLEDEKKTRIRCGIGDFAVSNGLLNSKLFVLDTADSNIKGDVKINLKNETINARLDAEPKDGSLLSLQSPLVVTGKLKKPNVGIDLASTGARGGIATLLGTILTPLAAILPFIGTAEGEDENCQALMSRLKH